MKKLTAHSVLAASALAVGALIGASALVALADSTWTTAPGTPGTNNVSAPLNVGSSAQVKTGLLGLGSLQFQPSGAVVATGSVMTAVDSYGTVGWSTAAGGSVNAQTGTVTKAATSSSGTVTFSPAFSTAPKVMASVAGYYAVGSCSSAGFGHVNTAGPYNMYGSGVYVGTVTATGFTYYTPYHNDGCNKYGISAVSWMAVGN